MAPPPSTPAPSRFLPSRRQAQGSQAGLTPGLTQSSGATTAGAAARQFVATPRFGPASSTQREQSVGLPLQQQQPPPFSTPLGPVGSRAFGGGSSARPRSTLPSDLIDSSPDSPNDEERRQRLFEQEKQRRAHKRRAAAAIAAEDSDSILGDSPTQSQRYSSQHLDSDEEDDVNEETDDDEQPAPKRRRLSIQSEPEVSSQPDAESENSQTAGDAFDVPDDAFNEEPVLSQSSDNALMTESADDDHHPMVNSDEDMDLESESDRGLAERPRRGQAQGKPTFHKAPRFKLTEPPPPDEDAQFPLPENFSPHRRGHKYVPGGLAAEVRDWLFQVKGDRSAKDDPYGGGGVAQSVIKVSIDDVSTAPGVMRLVRARRLPRAGESTGISSSSGSINNRDQRVMKLILAGDGRTSGLGGEAMANQVVKGSTVAIHPPTWEVCVRGQGSWIMVCDWSMADHPG